MAYDKEAVEEHFRVNPKHKLFADEWLTGENTGKRFNALRAYGYAGYSTKGVNPAANASKLLRHPVIKEYTKHVLETASMSAEEVLMRFTEIARGSAGEAVVIDPHNGLKLDPQKVLEMKHLIKSVGHDSNGNPKVEFHDSMDALKQLARILGMNKDGFDLLGSGGSATLRVEFVDAHTGQTEEHGATSEANQPVDE